MVSLSMLPNQNAGDRADKASYSSEHFTVPSMQKSHMRNLNSAKANRHANRKLDPVHKLVSGRDQKFLMSSSRALMMNSARQGLFNPVCHGDSVPSAASNDVPSVFHQSRNC